MNTQLDKREQKRMYKSVIPGDKIFEDYPLGEIEKYYLEICEGLGIHCTRKVVPKRMRKYRVTLNIRDIPLSEIFKVLQKVSNS